jgi:hypothetical protein
VSLETDDTVRLKPPRAGRRSPFARFWPYAAGTAALAGVAAAWLSLHPATAPPPPPTETAASVPPSAQPTLAPAPAQQTVASAAPGPVEAERAAPPASLPAAPAPLEAQQASPPASATASLQQAAISVPAPKLRFSPPLATEAEILADAPEQLSVYRFAPFPSVVVLQFPSLAEQARMLNRIAALIEKDGFPRDRVLAHDDLNTRIRASGVTPETFYYGHDYRAEDVVHFFALATELNSDEQLLHELVTRLGWHEHGPVEAVISLVRENAGSDIDRAARATILRHELSHGLYFTDPAYVGYCYRFWNEVLTARERGLFTAYLRREGYDPALTDLIVNETQAYLIHTSDPRFFRPADVGLTDARADELRRIFLAGMPQGWLRDAAFATLKPATPIRVRSP